MSDEPKPALPWPYRYKELVGALTADPAPVHMLEHARLVCGAPKVVGHGITRRPHEATCPACITTLALQHLMVGARAFRVEPKDRRPQGA